MSEKVSNTLRAIRSLQSEMVAVRTHLEAIETRLDTRVDGLQGRLVEMEVRVTTEVVAVAGLVRELATRLVQRDPTPRIDALDRRVTTLEQRKK